MKPNDQMKVFYKIALLEIILILGSVLVYRSLWLWLDKFAWLHTLQGKLFSFIIGVSIIAWASLKLHQLFKK